MKNRAEALSALEAELGVMIGRIRRVIADRARAVDPELQAGAYMLLGYVRAHGPVRASVIGEAYGMDKGAVSRQVQQLIDLDLLSRESDPADRRAMLLSVTDHGLERLQAVSDVRRQWLDSRLGGWSVEDLDQFVSILARYNRSLAQP